jgi:hypothetical protein
MNTRTIHRRYRRTESKLKGGAKEMYITYDVKQRTRSGSKAIYPKVKRVYIAGEVKGWEVGEFQKRTGRQVYGVRIEYLQERKRYHRDAFTASRGDTEYDVAPASIGATTQRFTQVVELPRDARDAQFYTDAKSLPERFRHALQNVR